MSALLLPGTNTIVLCPLALCKIVEAHLHDASYANKDRLRVTAVITKESIGATSFHFEVTTDGKPGEAA